MAPFVGHSFLHRKFTVMQHLIEMEKNYLFDQQTELMKLTPDIGGGMIDYGVLLNLSPEFFEIGRMHNLNLVNNCRKSWESLEAGIRGDLIQMRMASGDARYAGPEGQARLMQEVQAELDRIRAQHDEGFVEKQGQEMTNIVKEASHKISLRLDDLEKQAAIIEKRIENEKKATLDGLNKTNWGYSAGGQ